MESNGTVVSFDRSQFSQDALQRAAYWFTTDWDIEFVPLSDESPITNVVLRARNDRSSRMTGEIAVEFRQAVLDAQIRLQIGRETSGVRELILAKAFAEAGVLEPGEQ